MGNRPGDWSPLKLGGDPTPGDPDVLLSVADYMDAMAANAQTADTGLQTVLNKSGEGVFVGKTADYLREQISTEMKGFIAHVKEAFTAAGPAIRTYVTTLKDAQTRADKALADAAGADEARLATLKSDAETAKSDLQTAANTARGTINDAASRITSPTTPKSACDIFWEIFGWLTLIITIVAIFIGGPLGLIAFAMNAALAIKSIVDFATGKTNIAGLVIGLLGLLGPSTKPLITLADLTKLAATAWKSITKFSAQGFGALSKGLGDFWHAVTTFSFLTVIKGVGDLGAVMANTVKIGVLSLPKAISSLGSLAVHGFVTLEKFTLTTLPKGLGALGGMIGKGLGAVPGLAVDLGRMFKNGAIAVKNFTVQEFGGWKWLRIFTPLNGAEIGKLGVGGAFKVGVLGRGLNISTYKGLSAISGGVHLAEGIHSVNIVKPGDTPKGGGLNFSPAGLHLPDFAEPKFGDFHGTNVSFSAQSIDLSGLKSISGTDVAGVKGLDGLNGLPGVNGMTGLHGFPGVDLGNLGHLNMNVHGVPGGVDLSGLGNLGKLDVGGVQGLDGAISQVNLPSMGGLSNSVTLPNMQLGNLSAGLNKVTHGIDGLSSFGGHEIKALQGGEISAFKISDTGVSFNLGAPEKAFTAGPIDAGSLSHLHTGDLNAANVGKLDVGSLGNLTGNLGKIDAGNLGKIDGSVVKINPEVTLHQAMDLLADPKTIGIKPVTTHATPPHTPATAHTPNLGTGLTHDLSIAHSATPTVGKDLAGLPHQAPRPDQAGVQLSHEQALSQLKNAQDALAGASGDALSIARAQKDLRVAESLVKHTSESVRIDTLLADMPSVPTHNPGESLGELQLRLDQLRGGDAPTLLPHDGGTPHFTDTNLDLVEFPSVPTLSPAEAISRSVAADRLTHLTNDLTIAKAEHVPATPAAHFDDAALQARLDQLRGDDLPTVPHHDPAPLPGAAELKVRFDQLGRDVKSAHLAGNEVKALTDDIRKALTDGRAGDAAKGMNNLNERLDKHLLDKRLGEFRAHVDAGHGKAAQLGMDKVAWLEHAVGVEKAAAAGKTDELNQLLNAFEKDLSGHLAVQKLHDLPSVPDTLPAHSADQAGAPIDDLELRLAKLKEGAPTPEPVRLEEIRAGGADDAPPPSLDDLPPVPTHDPGDAALLERLTALRADHPGFGTGEAADWTTKLANAGSESEHATLLNQFHDRIAQLDREAKLGEIRDGSGPLPADELKTWQDALVKAGDNGAAVNRIAERYDLRLDQYRAQTGADINAALSAPDHLKPIDKRLDQGLSGLSRDLRDRNLADFSTFSDRLVKLRGSDDAPVLDAPAGGGFTHTDDALVFPEVPKDLPTTPKDLPSTPKDLPSTPKDLPKGPDSGLGGTSAADVPKSVDLKPAPVKGDGPPPIETPKASLGDETLQLAPPKVADDTATLPPRDLFGGGRTIEVDSERWTPLDDAFKFERGTDGAPPTISRPEASGERVGVRYQLDAGDDQWTFTLKVHLTGDATGFAGVEAKTLEGVDTYLNAPGYQVPGSNVPMQVKVQFVDDPAQAHAQITVAHDVPGMNQRTWAPGASPAAFAHEIVHYLGVKDGQAPPGALLHGPGENIPHDLMGIHGHDDGFVLAPSSLDQIAAVLAPHFSGSLAPRPHAPAVQPGHLAEQFWNDGVDTPPNVTEQLATPTVTPPVESIPMVPIPTVKITPPVQDLIEVPKPGSPLKGLYLSKPELVYEVDSFGDLTRLVDDLGAGVDAAVKAKVAETWKDVLPGGKVDAAEIKQAFQDDPQSFFATGGRSFDVKDGVGGWHRVTLEANWSMDGAKFQDQTVDKAKFDTRADHSGGTKQATTSGAAGSLGAGVVLPQRIGPGGGFAGEVALSRPMETIEDTAKLTDSHNVRSGGISHLVDTRVNFKITVSDVRGPMPAPTAPGKLVGADVTFRVVDDFQTAKPTAATKIDVTPGNLSMLVEHLTPVRILSAGLNLADDAVPTATWNEVAEQILTLLAPTKTVGPGTRGASDARGLLAESSIVANLIPALDSAVHPPIISSGRGAHALTLQVEATMPDLVALADVAKTSFRWQPGVSAGSKVSQTSRVGGSLSVIPIRWGFGPAYVQFRMFGGFYRSATASLSHGSTSRIGTEFKDIKNVAVEAHFKVTLTPALREYVASRLPFTSGATAPMVLDLVVLGRIPKTRFDELVTGVSGLKAPTGMKFVPPYALTGGRSVTYGLTAFKQLHGDVTTLIRRFEGGFLPKFTEPNTTKFMVTSKSALERQHNQAELDRVLSAAGLRQGNPTLLKTGLIAELTRTKKIGTRHLIVHVTAEYTDDFTYAGTDPGAAVRNARIDALQQKIVAAGQWRGGAAFEGGGVFRFTGDAATALVPSGAIEGRFRIGKQSGAQLTGGETRLNGGTPNSAAFTNNLQITVHVYSYTARTGIDSGSRVGVGRIIKQRFPSPATETLTREQVPHFGGQTMTRYSLTQVEPVTVLFDEATILGVKLDQPPVFTPRTDPLGLNRATKFDLAGIRGWVDQAGTVKIKDWLSVEGMPGSPFVLQLAMDALRGAQEYAEKISRTKLGGLRGVDGLLEGMPVWAAAHGKFTEADQVGALREMLNGQWHVDKLMTDEDGAAVDLAVSASLTNPQVLPAHGLITTENATTGGVEVDGAKVKEWQLAARGNFSANIRKPGTTKDTSGGGGVLNAGYERLLYAQQERKSESLSGVIERNANNRKGKTRSYLVKFDLKVSVAAEITTDPARYAMIPQALRTGDWLHHFKSIQTDGTISNAVYLRLSADVVDQLGLLPKLKGDTGAIGKPWTPAPDTTLRMPAGHQPGLGLYTFHETPTLTAEMKTALGEAAPDNKTLTKIFKTVTDPGLGDPMLNRRRLLYLFTPEGVAQHFPSMLDGGVSVLHMKPGKLTQHSRDVRLIAEITGEPEFKGFVADHDDLDIKTTHTSDSGTTVQRTHGSTQTLGVAGTGVSNHQGENLATGLGDTVGKSSQVSNSQGSGSTSVDTQLSSGRGVKARMKFPVKFSLVVFDKGRPTGADLMTVHDFVEQNRWADDLRLPRTSSPEAGPATYPIGKPAEMGPGWRELNGLPMPPRFSAEDLTQIKQLQDLVAGQLGDAAKRLKTPGYAGAHQIHQSLTPEILLPGVPQMMTETGLNLPDVTSAQIFGQKAEINIKLVPQGASVHGVSSGVFREHAPQTTSGYSAGTNAMTQQLRMPRLPLFARGYADDPYQALESGGPGMSAGDAQNALESGNLSTGSLGNVKPESASGLADYLSEVVVTVKINGGKPVAITGDLVNVSLRMGLHDMRTALDLASDTSARGVAFDRIVAHEAKLAKAAGKFVDAADALDQARFDAYGKPDLKVLKEAEIPGLIEKWEQAGKDWWQLEQQHYQQLDDFRAEHLGVSPEVADAGPLSQHVFQQLVDSVEPPPAPKALEEPPAPPKVEEPPAPPKTEAKVEEPPAPPKIETKVEEPPAPPKVEVKAPEVKAPPQLPTSQRLDVPGDGRCQLYSVIATDPVRVSQRLAAANLGSDHLHAWLNTPDLVREQTTDFVTNGVRDGNHLVPVTTELGQAAEQLRQLTVHHLRQAGPGGVPYEAVHQYRLSTEPQVRARTAGMDRAQVTTELNDLGIDRIPTGELLPVPVLRGAYLSARAEHLMADGLTEDAARATAALEVPLKDGVNLADESLSMQQMLDYLHTRNTRLDLNNLGEQKLRDLLISHHISPERPFTQTEFDALVRAVGTWERHWQNPLGEAFLPSLASALDAEMRVIQPGVAPVTVGREGAPLIEVHRVGNHYNAGISQVPARIVEIDAERWTALDAAIRFETRPDGTTRAVRSPGSGERVGVHYQLTATDRDLRFQLKVHLSGEAAGFSEVRTKTALGVEKYLNEPGHTLPGTNLPMHVSVQFVDDPAQAHAHITVAKDAPGMNQGVWSPKASPAAFAHEVVHYLGVKDSTPPPGAVLHGATDDTPHSLMGHQHQHDGPYVLSDAARQQIADVLAPHFSLSTAPRPPAVLNPEHLAEPFWTAGLDTPPNVNGNPLSGLYQRRPELVYELDNLGDTAKLADDLAGAVDTAVRAKVAESWKGWLPGGAADTAEIKRALLEDAQSFFVTGGRSFDVGDGLGGWHRVTVEPTYSMNDAKLIEQKTDKAKFDTRTDQAITSKEANTSGGTGAIGANVIIPQRMGPGGGVGGELALSRPLESSELSAKLTDSHNVRSGGISHLVDSQVTFKVTVSEARGPMPAADAPAQLVKSGAKFRIVDDFQKATPSSATDMIDLGPEHTPMRVENLTPVRILHAGLNLGDADVPSGTWNQVAEEILTLLAPTKAVDPGTAGARDARALFSESSMLANLMPALDSPVHPPLLTSSRGAHALSLQMSATLPQMEAIGDVAKTSFRWQPGLSTGAKVTQTSRVGGALSVVPIRWAFGPAYVQFRLFGGFIRSATASSADNAVSRIGTEFKDIGNVAVEARFRLVLTPALREYLGSRLPFTSGAVDAVTIDLVVLGRLPMSRLTELTDGATRFDGPIGNWHVPPYALTGGRSVTNGLSAFQDLQTEVTELVRSFEGGFLPKFAAPGRTKFMATSKSALERGHNQAELDRVLSAAGLRQGNPSLLKFGLIAELTRTKKIGVRHLVVHVTGRYTDGFTHLGTEKGTAVRNARADGTQQRIVASGQWRYGGTVEGGGVFRFSGKASTALVPSGAIEVRGRTGRQSGAQLSGSETRLNGGTPNSQAFGNNLEITVKVYAFTERLGHDPRSRVQVGRVVRERMPRQAERFPAEQVPHIGGTTITRYRLTSVKPVTVLFDEASVVPRAISHPPVFTARADPLALRRATKFDLTTLRDWVDAGPSSPVRDWLSVEAMPASTYVLQLATDALRAAQDYVTSISRTRIAGLRGIDGLLEGMPLWAALLGRFTEADQVSALRSMLGGRWHVDRVSTDENGASVDLAVSATLTNPEILPAHSVITTETASIGGVEVDGAKTQEWQLAARGNFSTNIRKTGTSKDTSGGGGLLNAGYERLIYATAKRDSSGLSGAIERNANNRKGKTRSYLVKFDLKVSVGAEITTDPDRFAVIPQALRTGDWLHHFKSIQTDGTVTNAVYLRLSAEVVETLGLLPKLPGDLAYTGMPWLPSPATLLRLAPGHTAGLGLYTFHHTPSLTGEMTTGLQKAAAGQESLARIWKSLSEPGLGDPMLNRRRLLYLFTPEGVAQHFPSMLDGGMSVLHLKPGRMTQHSRDIRLIAELTGEPEFQGFVADHNDLDIKTTGVSDSGTTVQRTHGHTVVAGAAGTGVSNHHGENLAMGLGDTVGKSSQVSNSQGSGQASVDTQLSSGRGIKARMRFPVKFSLVVFDKGERIGSSLLTAHDFVEQNRWADDLRLPRISAPPAPPKTYEIKNQAIEGTGWSEANGLPMPPRYSAEDLTQIAQLQKLVETQLADAARRLKTPGYAGAHQIHQSLTPELLLPNVPQMLTTHGLDLPEVTSAQIFGQHAKINIKLLPEGASLGGVSSGVFREHAPLQTAGYSAGTNKMVQNLRAPRVPLIGRGFADDPYQALEAGGPGIATGDSQAATESGSLSTGALGNVKPESASGLVDYLSRVVVTVTLKGKGTPVRGGLMNVSLRMGLHDAKIALDLTGDRAPRFAAIEAHEATVFEAAEAFIKAADALDQARFEAYGKPGLKDLKTAELPGLNAKWVAAGETWWALEQRHYQLLDAFRNDFLGLAPSVKTAPSLAAPPPLPAPPPVSRVLDVPGDGRCQLYSFVATAPALVSERLTAIGYTSEHLTAWLGNADAVRAQTTALTTNGQRDRNGLVPTSIELGAAADQLRRLALRHLEQNGPGSVPPAAIHQYRLSTEPQVSARAATMTRGQLVTELHQLGLTTVTQGHLLPMTLLRDRYLEERTVHLFDVGLDPDFARSAALDDVPLTASGNLADDSLSMQGMLDYLTGRGLTVDVDTLPEPVLRDVLTNHHVDPDRPLSQAEFDALTNAVTHWEDHWKGPLGEAFLPVLADALDVRARVIHPTGVPTMVGRTGAPLIEVHRIGNHYNAGRSGQDFDAPFGDPVWPKKVKPFELHPPKGPAEKGAKGADLAMQEVRLNPAWMPLADFHPNLFEGRPDAHWHYVVTPDGEIYIGSEEILTVVSDAQLRDLHAGMVTKNPDLTLDQLRDSINQQGHPTIGARFDGDGKSYAGQARVSGELGVNPATGRWEVNDKSGRYMSGKVRPDLQVADVKRWLANVAERMTAQFGIPVEPRLFKHAEAPTDPKLPTDPKPPVVSEPAVEDVRARFVELRTRELVAAGNDPMVAKVLAGGIKASQEEMVAALAAGN
ncbi:hypothetical protein [Actinoplanes sp. L3-i22]|uniref:hypothetical protein n=1 Tax=Actinoplanes sp. L3-i22 TaxID=2836373 RepID=UPI001C75C8E2|nr:hypothetical protein [Actinoplanes sp. L3-i22]BCY15452.1 hypothetical protein L3i22_105400 [Actinoplanes sp. L3-i22]